MGRIDLVTGGARSGKSGLAERLASSSGQVVFVATATAMDAEMEERIARHRARRSAAWRTVEAPLDAPAAAAAAVQTADVVILDCLGVWAANRLLSLGDPHVAGWWGRVTALEASLIVELDAALVAAREGAGNLVLVTNEVGFGVVPAEPLGRAFRDLLGRLNQRAASVADRVALVVAGIPVDLLSLAAQPGARPTSS